MTKREEFDRQNPDRNSRNQQGNDDTRRCDPMPENDMDVDQGQTGREPTQKQGQRATGQGSTQAQDKTAGQVDRELQDAQRQKQNPSVQNQKQSQSQRQNQG